MMLCKMHNRVNIIYLRVMRRSDCVWATSSVCLWTVSQYLDCCDLHRIMVTFVYITLLT